MASLYPRKNSIYWWVKFVDANGRTVSESTKLRRDNPIQTAQARSLRATLEAAEALNIPGRKSNELTGGWDYVEMFLANHCRGKSPKTLERYRQAWHWISLFLAHHKIRHPRDVRFAHGQQFVDWRKTRKKRNTGNHVSHNTAVLDVKIFGMILQRAVQLGIAFANPLVRLGIGREEVDEAPPITAAEFAKIEPALAKKGEWMRHSFLIARETGCRLRDTRLARSSVDFERGVIHFPNPKGGKKKAFSIPLPGSLHKPLEAIFADGRKIAFELPGQPSVRWREFFDGLDLPHLRFHCLRATYVTKLALEGVPPAAAMALVNHGDPMVHRIYQRLNVDHLRQWVSARPSSAPSAGQSDAGAKA